MDDPGEDRAALIRRRFKSARLDAMGRSFWGHWHTEDCAFLVGMYATVLILFLEPALWSDAWLAGVVDVRIPGTLAAALLLVLPFNGWLLNRFLSGKTPHESTLPRWLLWARLLAASLPLVGLYTISVWGETLERNPSLWASRSVTLDLSRRRGLRRSDTYLRVLYRSGFFFVWVAGGLVPLLVWAVWLTQSQALGLHRRTVIFAACALLHIVSSLSMALHLRSEIQTSSIRGWRRSLLSTAPVLWLLAIPGMVLGFTAFLLADPPKKSLTWLAYAGRTGANRDPLWRSLQGDLRQQWERKPWFRQWSRPAGLLREKDVGQAEAHVIAFYRLKTLFLALDSAAFFGTFRKAGFSWIPWTAIALASVGLMIQGLALSARLLRISRLAEGLARHPQGRYLLLTQTALLAGLYTSLLHGAGQVEQLGLLLCYGGALCGVSAVLFLLLPTAAPPQGPDMTLWALLFLSISAWGGLIALDGRPGQPSLVVLETLALLTPLWSLGLFLLLGRWLVRPFSWNQVFDLRYPSIFRFSLLFMVLSAALPLGGIAIPIWIHFRHRNSPAMPPF